METKEQMGFEMLSIMLCGASDTGRIAIKFEKVVRAFGGDPWYYQSGRISYLNSATSNKKINSKQTVRESDLCVFVLIQEVGKITWMIEIREALSIGKPILIFCYNKTYKKYLAMQQSELDFCYFEKKDRDMIDLLKDLDRANLTIVPFELSSFENEFRSQLSSLFSKVLRSAEIQNQRNRILYRTEKDVLSSFEISILLQIALDEVEDKNIRKKALSNLCKVGIDEKDCLKLLSSDEQGIQRMCANSLKSLYRCRPADVKFFKECVDIANNCDEIGVARRLAPVLLEIDLALGLDALMEMDFSDLGVRRRVVSAIESKLDEIITLRLSDLAVQIIKRCMEREDNIKNRCKSIFDKIEVQV